MNPEEHSIPVVSAPHSGESYAVPLHAEQSTVTPSPDKITYDRLARIGELPTTPIAPYEVGWRDIVDVRLGMARKSRRNRLLGRVGRLLFGKNSPIDLHTSEVENLIRLQQAPGPFEAYEEVHAQLEAARNQHGRAARQRVFRLELTKNSLAADPRLDPRWDSNPDQVMVDWQQERTLTTPVEPADQARYRQLDRTRGPEEATTPLASEAPTTNIVPIDRGRAIRTQRESEAPTTPLEQAS